MRNSLEKFFTEQIVLTTVFSLFLSLTPLFAADVGADAQTEDPNLWAVTGDPTSDFYVPPVEASDEAQPADLPMYMNLTEEDYKKLEARGYPREGIDNALSAQRAAAGLEMESVSFGQFDWSGLAPSIEKNYVEGKVDLEVHSHEEVMATMNPEERSRYKAAVFKENFGIIKPYTEVAVNIPGSEETGTLIYANNYRDQLIRQPDAFASPKTNSALIDIPKVVAREQGERKYVEEIGQVFKESDEDFHGLGTEKMDARSLIQDDFAHEVKGHIMIDGQIRDWSQQGVPLDVSYYFLERPPRQLWEASTHELGAMLQELSDTKSPQFVLVQMSSLAQKMLPGATEAEQKVGSPEHTYAASSIFPRMLHDLGYSDYIADKLLETKMLEEDWGPTDEDIQRAKEYAAAKEVEYMGKKYLANQIQFIQTIDPQKITELAKKHREALFGASPAIEIPEIPKSVQEDIDFERSFRKTGH